MIISLTLHLLHRSSAHNPETDQVFNYQGSLLLRGASRDFLKEASARNDCVMASINLDSVITEGRAETT